MGNNFLDVFWFLLLYGDNGLIKEDGVTRYRLHRIRSSWLLPQRLLYRDNDYSESATHHLYVFGLSLSPPSTARSSWILWR